MPVLTSAWEEPVQVDFDFSLKKEVSLVSFGNAQILLEKGVWFWFSHLTRRIGKLERVQRTETE